MTAWAFLHKKQSPWMALIPTLLLVAIIFLVHSIYQEHRPWAAVYLDGGTVLFGHVTEVGDSLTISDTYTLESNGTTSVSSAPHFQLQDTTQTFHVIPFNGAGTQTIRTLSFNKSKITWWGVLADDAPVVLAIKQLTDSRSH